MEDQFIETISPVKDWKARLHISEDRKVGFAAPGGEFTRAFASWIHSQKSLPFAKAIQGKRIIELGAGMYSYGYLLSALLGSSSYVGVEPFYADYLLRELEQFSKFYSNEQLPKYRVSSLDMLSFLKELPDESGHIFACGIESCILPGEQYAAKVEQEIGRVIGKEYYFFSYQSDLHLKTKPVFSDTFQPDNRKKRDRVIVY